jgi:DNA polymerase III subunit delta
MKLTWKEIGSFVKTPAPSARVILVYGPDHGLMKERANTMAKTIVTDLQDPFNVAVLSADGLMNDPARLFDEAGAISMMGGARLIRVENAGDKITPILKDYLKSPSMENLVLLEAGELGKNSSLRLLCEKAGNAAAMPCYVDDERATSTLIRAMATENGFSVQGDAVQWLSINIAGDRAQIRSELEKLFLYMGKNSKTITLDDARAACGTGGDQSIDDLLYAVGAGRIETAIKHYTALIEEGVAVVTILRALQTHFRKLHLVHSTLNSGQSLDQAMKLLHPPVFFKYEDAFKAQLKKYSPKKLMLILDRLSQIEAQTKTTGAPSETLAAQAILSLAAQS